MSFQRNLKFSSSFLSRSFGLLVYEGARVAFSVNLKKLEKELHVNSRCSCFLESSFGVIGRAKLKKDDC